MIFEVAKSGLTVEGAELGEEARAELIDLFIGGVVRRKN
jgi:hypothetical protein